MAASRCCSGSACVRSGAQVALTRHANRRTDGGHASTYEDVTATGSPPT